MYSIKFRNTKINNVVADMMAKMKGRVGIAPSRMSSRPITVGIDIIRPESKRLFE